MKVFESQEEYYRVHSKFYDATRWAFLFGRNSLKDFFPELPEKSRILDIGCGTGKQLLLLRESYPDAEIIGMDRSEAMLRIADQKTGSDFVLRNESYNSKSFSENTFDLIVGSYSLTMVDELQKTLDAILMHLKPGGYIAAVDFDTSPFNWFMDWMKINHVEMKENLFDNLAMYFPENSFKSRKAYFGLYTYSFFLGKNTGD